jgi:hypothetical protein
MLFDLLEPVHPHQNARPAITPQGFIKTIKLLEDHSERFLTEFELTGRVLYTAPTYLV